MKNSFTFFLFSFLVILITHSSYSDEVTEYKKIYAEDFQKEPLGELSDDFLTLDGQFQIIKNDKGNKSVELAGEPLGDHGFLFGEYLESNIRVRCKILAKKKRRSYPSFGLGIHGVGGYQLRVSPAKRKIEILFEEEVVSQKEFRWLGDGKWTALELSLSSNNKKDAWKLEGFVWEQGKKKPKTPIISYPIEEEPFGGESSVFGTPYSGHPILFDDLEIYSSDK